MRLRNVLLPATLLAMGMWAQSMPGQGAPPLQSGIAGYLPAAGYENLKQAIGLTDAQVRQLQEIQKARQVQSQASYQQMAAKQKQLNDLLNADSTDAMALGQLEIEIAKLRKQAAAQAPVKDQNLAVLTEPQRAKLADLQNALKLQRAASEAMGLGLIDPPAAAFGPGRALRQ